jgi:ribosome-associated translation inhibitor RaiA
MHDFAGGLMKIQVNSDRSISVNASLTRYVKGELTRVLRRFAGRLTRVEVHLSDVNSWKPGQADKRCLIEARPAGARPLTTSAKASSLASAVGEAAGKMKRLLSSFIGRKGRIVATIAVPVSTSGNTKVKKGGARESSLGRRRRTSARRTATKKPRKLSPRGPKKKWIYQARRKPWPKR